MRFLFSRLIKVLANLLKLFCYGFHAVFPKKRFTIPKQANPLWRSKKKRQIPQILWQTNYTNQVTLPVYLNYLCNRLLAPTYEYRYMSTEDRQALIEKTYDQRTVDAYSRLSVGAAQADMWRLLVLNQYGGVYMDIDAHLIWPLSATVKPSMSALYIKHKRGEFTNYFIASVANNQKLRAMVDLIIDNINQGDPESVYSLTGPTVTNTVLKGQQVEWRMYRDICLQGNFTNEYFQYIDHPRGKWTKVKANEILH